VSWSIGLSSGARIDWPVAKVLEVFHQLDVPGVELATRPDHFDIRRPEDVAAVSARLHAFGIQPVSIHAPFGKGLDVADARPEVRAAGVNAALEAGRALKHAGGRLVVVHPSDLVRHEHQVNARLEDAARSLTAAAAQCQKEGLVLAVESPLPHLIGGHPDEFAWLLGKIPADVKVCLDTGHTTLGGFWDRFVEIAAGRLMHVHANDNHGRFDDHLPPGDGNIDWGHIVRTLREAQFAGWIMLELHCADADLTGYVMRALRQAEALRG
jgi:sugar phosphate isomerase/epimerase